MNAALQFAQFAQDMDWIESNYDRLKSDYGDQYVVVVNSAVIDHGSNINELLARLASTYGDRVPELAMKLIYRETPNMVFTRF